MQKSKFYHQFTDYDKEPGGLRKLDFIVETLRRYFGNRPTSTIRILDVGCGNGNISLPLASLGYQILGIDLDFVSIKNVQKKNQFPNAKFFVFDANKISQLGKFDCVIASEFFEHLKNPQELAKKIFQILNSDGLLIASIPNGQSLLEFFRWFLGATKFGRVIKKFLRKTILKKETLQSEAESLHQQFFSLKKFKKILQEGGFKILEIKNSSAIFGESFYLFWRFFLKRGSTFFHFLDTYDNQLAERIPTFLAVGWIIVGKKSK